MPNFERMLLFEAKGQDCLFTHFQLEPTKSCLSLFTIILPFYCLQAYSFLSCSHGMNTCVMHYSHLLLNLSYPPTHTHKKKEKGKKKKRKKKNNNTYQSNVKLHSRLDTANVRFIVSSFILNQCYTPPQSPKPS